MWHCFLTPLGIVIGEYALPRTLSKEVEIFITSIPPVTPPLSWDRHNSIVFCGYSCWVQASFRLCGLSSLLLHCPFLSSDGISFPLLLIVCHPLHALFYSAHTSVNRPFIKLSLVKPLEAAIYISFRPVWIIFDICILLNA